MTGWRPPCVQHRSAETQPSLFDLAPGGACHASRVAARAVRSYRTLSPLPRKRGGLLSVALSLKRPKPLRRALPGTVPSWSPDFPRTLTPRGQPHATVQPSDAVGVSEGAAGRNDERRATPVKGCAKDRSLNSLNIKGLSLIVNVNCDIVIANILLKM